MLQTRCLLKNQTIETGKVFKFVLIGVFVPSMLALLGYAHLIEPNQIEIERIAPALEKLPPSLEGRTIVQLSDIQVNDIGLRPREEETIRLVNELEPDLIVLTGDFLETGSDFALAAQNAGVFVSQLRARYGVWAVRGDNDFSRLTEKSDLLLEQLADNGARVLVNEAVEPFGEGSGLFLIGAEYMGFRPYWAADFTTREHKANTAMAVGFSQKNAYTHFAGEGAQQWQNYEFSGRMLHTRAGGGVGITFYSRFLEGFDRFYRLRRLGVQPTFHFAPHGTIINNSQLNSDVRSQPNIWYHFRIQVESQAGQTVMRAKVWPEGTGEPTDWQMAAYDDSPSRLTAGTIGLWGDGPGRKLFDDLQVRPLQGLTEGNGYLSEDFTAFPPDTDPADWLDFGIDEENVRQSTVGLPQGAPKIMLVHSSDLVLEAARLGVDLVLSGGTQGGQIRLPFIGALYTGTKLGRRYSAGLYDFGRTRLYINRGIGTSIVPLRLLSPPEITVITLTTARSSRFLSDHRN